MSYPLSLRLEKKQAQTLKQTQRLIMSPQMQQAIKLLQVPVLELAQMVEAEMETNPILEYSSEENGEEEGELAGLEESISEEATETDIDPNREITFEEGDFDMLKRLDEEYRDFLSDAGSYYTKRTADEEKLKSFLENSLAAEKSLYDHLIEQSQEEFNSKEEIEAAAAIIGNINAKGYLSSPLEEISMLNHIPMQILQTVLAKIQTFDPPGIGALSLRESLLIQLKLKHKEGTLSYRIIDAHFDALLHNRLSHIAKKLHCTPERINEAIQKEISHLNMHPGTNFSKEYVQQIVPDITISQEGELIAPMVNDDGIPNIKINYKYLKMYQDPSLPDQARNYIMQKILSARWLMRNIDQRNNTLYRIALFLIERQKAFFMNPKGELTPLTMKQVAEELQLHESTIARAVANKHLACDRGLFPLRHFFSGSYVNEEGEDISSTTVRDMVETLISQEDKKHPLSDMELSKMLKNKGITCARRTIAKYRSALEIGTAQQRKQYTDGLPS